MAPTETAPAVIAYDGSDEANAAIDAAGRLAAERPVVVLCVWESFADLAPAGRLGLPSDIVAGGAQKLDAEATARATELAEEGAERLRQLGVEASAAIEKSDPNVWKTIVDFGAQREAAMILVGSRGRSGIKSALLGSVSNGVVNHSACPVLVVRD